MNTGFLGPAVATVLTVHGIETTIDTLIIFVLYVVATVLTVHGIETELIISSLIVNPVISCNSTYRSRY